MTDINELQARIGRHGVARPNRFQVEFTPPQRVIDLFGGDINLRLAIQCEAARLPGKSFSTRERRIYGPLIKFPYVATYTSAIDLTFRVGSDFKERSLFDVWQSVIMDPKTNMFGYLHDYATEFVIHQLNHEDGKLYSVKLVNAYPEAIQALELSAEAGNTYHKQIITFAYQQWEETNALPLTFPSTTSTKKAENGFVETYLLKAGAAFFDQLPRITGSGGTLFGSTFNQSF